MPDTSAVRSLLTDVLGCDASLAVGDAVYVSASNTVAKADASSVGTADVLGFIVQKPTTTTCIVQVAGECSIFTSLTPDTLYYLSDTAGGIQSTPGTVSVKIGLALDATTIMLVPGGSGLGGVASPWLDGSGTNSAIQKGNTGSASGISAVAANDNTTAGGNYSFAEGFGTSASESYAHASGNGTSANGISSFTTGENGAANGRTSFTGGKGAVAALHSQWSRSNFYFGAIGDTQYSLISVSRATAGASPTELFLDPNGGTGRLVIPSNTTWSFVVTILARQQIADGTKCAQFMRRGIIENLAGTTALVGSVVTVGSDLGSNGGAPPAGWAVAITADDTNNSLKIEVTGEAATDIRWLAKVELVEVSYP